MIQKFESGSAEVAKQAEIQYKLASLWLAKGRFEQAITGFRQVLQLQPSHTQAMVHLDHALRHQKEASQPLVAQFADTDETQVSFGDSNQTLVSQTVGKIAVNHQKVFAAHRCGWQYAIFALQSLHNPEGVLFDGFLENSFIWKYYQPGQVRVPYNQPWVGFLHNPPDMPAWFQYRDSPQALFAQASWQQSLEQCVGLFCLSEYYAQWLRKHTELPVSALIYPTEIPEKLFDFDKFSENAQKKIVQLGWWLRKLNAIYQLPILKENPLGYEKVKLNPEFAPNAKEYLQELCERERKAEKIVFQTHFLANTQELSHLSNQDYDELLSQNIGFIALYDASANNAVVECIARATPLLINPLPAVVEYLGEDYPMYFHTLEEAADKAMDLGLIKATHEYLLRCETRQKLSAQHFLQTFINSDVYRKIA
ncbi:MAG: tetratricopeptide repeat protein [Cyanobacteria bacterium J06626_6]